MHQKSAWHKIKHDQTSQNSVIIHFSTVMNAHGKTANGNIEYSLSMGDFFNVPYYCQGITVTEISFVHFY